MYFTVLVTLATSTISSTLSALTHYAYANLFFEFISQAFPKKWNSSKHPRSEGSKQGPSGDPPGYHEPDHFQAGTMFYPPPGSGKPIVSNYLLIKEMGPGSPEYPAPPIYPYNIRITPSCPSNQPPIYNTPF
jgi:hypothetical protein